MSSSDELDVSVAAINAGPTPGQKLRLAREKCGLSLDAVTAETNLSLKYLQALETDDYAALPGLAFARGYARRYAQLVHLDGSALIAEMDVLAAAQGVTVPVSLNASSAAMLLTSNGISQVATRKASDAPSSMKKLSVDLQKISFAQILSVGSLALLVLLLLGTLFWQGSNDTNTEPMADNGVIDIDADVAQQAPPEPLPVIAEPVPTTPALDAVPVSAVEAVPAAGATPAASTAAPVAATPVPAPTTTTAPLAATAVAAAPVAAAPSAASPAKTPAPAIAPVQPVATKPAVVPPVPPSIDSLNFSFTGKSWISVRDATGQELVYGLKNAGQAVTVTGQAPFSINIGNVNVTTLSRNGRGVNLKQYARGEIASFRLAPSVAPKP
ncbi:MAG: RodZ domain-containing protein [Pseudomonadota bacterium]